ncbi:efflux RND transporter permease subunit [Lentisphaera marina]|uniref:efflux RND transporter permease subunit n=1 Tax=Lentisphaera marina TaxID=1111041 RepID=UPI0023667B0B|nr:efflux RND transporter permease subunit [Lentisphaera marina]MDD7986656.1 efflux RND transporter permease subunit [Lentisphaera marina]
MKLRFAILISLIAIVASSWFSLQKLSLDTSVNAIMGTDHRSRATYEKMDEAFKERTVVLAICKIDDLFSDAGVRKLYAISEKLKNMPELVDIRSLTHAARPVKRGSHFDIRKNIRLEVFLNLEKKTPEQWAELKDFICHYPMTRDLMISADGQYTMVLARLKNSEMKLQDKKLLWDELQSNVKEFEDQGIAISFLSEPILSAEFFNLTKDFVSHTLLAGLVLIFIIILLSFKSLKILAWMLALELLGAMICPVIFYLNNCDLNVYTCILIPLVLSLQLTFLVHFFAVYQQVQKKSKRPWTYALSRVFRPSCIALLTSFIAFGSLLLSEVQVLKVLGQLGLQYLLLVFVLSFAPFYFVSRNEKSDEDEHSDWQDKESSHHFLSKPIIKGKYFLYLGATLLFTISFFLFSDLETDMRAREFLTPKSETRESLELVNDHFGGLNIFQLKVVSKNKGGIQKYENVKYLHDLRNRAMKMPGVRNAYTYSQFYTTIHQLFLGDSLSHGNVFPPEEALFTYNLILNSQRFPFRDVLQNDELTESLFILRTDDVRSHEFIQIAEEFIKISKQNLPDGLEIVVPNGLQSILKSDQEILETQLDSLMLSLLSMLVLLLVLWRSGKYAVYAFLTAASALCSLILVMYIADIKLNSITVMSGTILLGIVVDDAIHFLSYYRHSIEQGHSAQSSLANCFQTKLKPMICTSLILSVCFALFCFSPYPPMREFGLSGALTLLCGLVASCLFLPALLSLKEKL